MHRNMFMYMGVLEAHLIAHQKKVFKKSARTFFSAIYTIYSIIIVLTYNIYSTIILSLINRLLN